VLLLELGADDYVTSPLARESCWRACGGPCGVAARKPGRRQRSVEECQP